MLLALGGVGLAAAARRCSPAADRHAVSATPTSQGPRTCQM